MTWQRKAGKWWEGLHHLADRRDVLRKEWGSDKSSSVPNSLEVVTDR